MRAKLLNERPERTYALVFETGDAFMKTLQGFAREKQLAGSHFTAIGAFREAMLGYFDWEKKDYQRRGHRQHRAPSWHTARCRENERGREHPL
jgi:predicted DNA-binding protein with PD1-like motif